jgi:hypothetical protein
MNILKRRGEEMDAINYLKTELNIDMSSRIRAVQDAGALEFDENTYRRVIGEMLELDDVNISDDHAKHTFMYIVQDLASGLPAQLEVAEEKAIKFVAKNPWEIIKPDYSQYYEPKSTVDALGQPKQKKGAKKDAAIAFWNANQDKNWTRKEWITNLAEAVGLTPAAASTYYYNVSKKVWK